MSQIKTLNGVQYTLPQYNDTGWGANTGNVLTQYMAAIADVTLQLSGGSFTLTADVDFGANFGLKALFLKSETTNPASAGVVRLAKTDSIKWRNNANGADIALTIDGSDNLTYASNKVYTAGGAAGIVNADIASGAAIAYSKLALTGSIVNADINAAAAIAYSKLTLTGSIVNADINASAAIAYSKLALTGAILNADLAGSIAYSKLTLTGSIVNGDLTAGTLTNTAINASAAIALSKLAALGTAKAVQTNASTGFLEASSVTNTELGYVSGVTSAIQTQINAISAKVFQYVLASGTTQTSSTSTSYAASVVTGSITPASSSHRVKVTVCFLAAASNNTNTITYTLERNTTDLLGSNGMYGEKPSTPFYISYTFIDSPATTSATSYTVYVKTANAGTAVQAGSTNSTWTVTMEEIV